MSGRPVASPGDHEVVERPLLAVGLVLLAMLVFTSTDAIAKYLTSTLAAQQIIWVRYGVILAILMPLLVYRRAQRLLRTQRPWLHLLRGLLVMISSMLFIQALERLPLELCTAIGFVSPLYVTALSIPLLGEKVGARRWCAVAIGFLGVLVILRPGSAAFQWAMLIPLVSSFCWGLGLIITRLMRGSEQALTVLAWSSIVGFIAAAPFALPLWRDPSAMQWLALVALGALNALAQYLVIKAFMMASASVLAPFSYSTIVWAILLGAIVFGSVPDLPTVLGTLVLAAAGLYVWHRERVRATPATVPGASLGETVEPDC